MPTVLTPARILLAQMAETMRREMTDDGLPREVEFVVARPEPVFDISAPVLPGKEPKPRPGKNRPGMSITSPRRAR